MITSVNDIRRAFLDFFVAHAHHEQKSAPLVPHHDPTLMFTNAGMVPFKHVFSGAETLLDTKGHPIRRATSSQKCVRAGGKHNDLDNVGYTARHHTFFEMLGNFSFGDYFKEEAISLAWEFLTSTLQLPKDKLYITVYHTDDEAYDLWHKLTGFGPDHILRIATNDNFWAMGDTGPCGPCSEIFYDHGDHIAGGLPGTPQEDGDRFIEIWNLVFMQYEQQKKGRIDLPTPCIDTGMGLERISALLQGTHDNYGTDLFQALITASREKSGNADHETSHRVIADHLRSSAFLLADGVMPSNEGRGYVLRRIMRRAMRHAHLLGCGEPLMHQLVPTLLHEMGDAYPELRRADALIRETLKAEETRFGETLGRGIALLDEAKSGLKAGDALGGEVAFKLYDTYGFPADLTEDILRGESISIDQSGFDAAMDAQKARARAAWKGSGDASAQAIWLDLHSRLGASEFLGYKTLEASATVQAILHEGQEIQAGQIFAEGSTLQVLCNQTPFYAESGGQAGDYGVMIGANNACLRVTDTQKQAGSLHVHYAVLETGQLRVGDVVELQVDVGRHQAIKANHSATHLLHAVLREVLGPHVTQKGSLVEADYFRFDFSHGQALSAEKLEKVAQKTNRLIRQNTATTTQLMRPDDAIEAGAMALFGEKYGEEVRVLSMGKGLHQHAYSVELCGGTHVAYTGEIGLFVITSETSIASGVRRIEAVTGAAAEAWVAGHVTLSQALSDQFKCATEAILPRIDQLRDEQKQLQKQISQLQQKLALGGSGDSKAEDISGIAFLGKILEDVPGKELRGLAEQFQQKIGAGVVVLVATETEKASIVVSVSEENISQFNAVELVQIGTQALGGKGGGGKPGLAQAGGPNPDAAHEAIEAIKNTLAAV